MVINRVLLSPRLKWTDSLKQNTSDAMKKHLMNYKSDDESPQLHTDDVQIGIVSGDNQGGIK